MRLTRVKIFGFKTFADATEFDLTHSLVAVIGPNGCGKSNLVDAILWGLGEGSAKQLRASTGTEVIFGGSQQRKPLGYAEVSLYFDNEAGELPIDAPEVVITRRITAGGESTYKLNRQTCRLRDVHELLADSGLGRSGYSIVGQREIDQALSASAADRRAWLDEAAGTQRYRIRKQDSQRRLQSANSHLERVGDILAEIETQREPLREEAEAAKRYREIQHALQQVESNLLIVEIEKAHLQMSKALEQVREAQTLAEKESALSAELEAKASHLSADLGRHEAEQGRLVARRNTQAMRKERAEGDIRVAEGRLAHLAALGENFEAEQQQALLRQEEIKSELDILQAEAQREQDALQALRASFSGSSAEAKELSKRLTEVETRLKSEREREAQMLRAAVQAAHSAQRRKDLKRELAGIVASLPDLVKGIEEAQESEAALRAQLSALQEQITAIEHSAKGTSAELARLATAKREADSHVALLESRRRGLEMTLESHEGLAGGARAVMDLVEAGRLPNRYFPIGEIVSVDKEHAVAVEVALGNAIHDLIVPDPKDSREAIEILKQERLGRATFQPIPHMRPVVLTDEFRKLQQERGVIGSAFDLVSCDREFRPVLESLLGRVLVTERLDDALRLSKTSGWSKIVTMDGELVHHAGSVTGGNAQRSNYGMVQRRADITAIDEDLEALQARIKKLDKEIHAVEKESAEELGQIPKIRAEIEPLQGEVREAQSWLRSLMDEKASAERQQARLTAEMESLGISADDEQAPSQAAEWESQRDELVKFLAAKSADSQEAERRLSDAEVRLQQAHLRLEMAQKRLKSLAEQVEFRLKRHSDLEPELEKAQQGLALATKHRDESVVELAEVEALIQTHAETRQDLLDEREKAQQGTQQAQRASVAALQAAHTAELDRTRAEARKATTIQRLFEEYALSEEDALRLAPSVELPADAATLVSRLRRDLRALGEVNLGAIEAFERLTTRHEELDSQRRDLTDSISDLLAGIRELDKRTRDQFETTFEKVSEAFSRTFAFLFGGGTATLSLTEPGNILDSGIEIDVTLPGKRRQKLDLLSGGERSLCGLSFLFALLEVKPSPLVVLDEVDAPLDGRNVERFIDLLTLQLERTQFLVVTHNPTTISTAAVWLGVTMQEPGVSTLVPVIMPQPALVEA